MAQVRYDGPHAAVDVLSAEGTVTVARGEAVDVDEDTAKGLCEQDQWTRADAESKPATKGKGDV
jgi:hypothetical protein